MQHFGRYDDETTKHSGSLPVPSYRLATNEAFDGESNRGAYSFCMCPGKYKESFAGQGFISSMLTTLAVQEDKSYHPQLNKENYA